MEDVKKMEEATKAEELAERVELTDDQLDQASGGMEARVIHQAGDIVFGKNIKAIGGSFL